MSRSSDDSGRRAGAHTGDRFALETLEPRVLLSAELGGGLDLLQSDDDEAVADGLWPPGGDGMAVPTDDAGAPADDAPAPRRELVFVDSAVDGHAELIAALHDDRTRDFRIHLIEHGDDGLAEISTVLATQRNVDAVHLVAHGEDGALWLAGERLDDAAFEARADQLLGWREHLSADADLLLYGCDFASGESGSNLVSRLALLTGADVAASNDATGSSLLGGDWDLEHQVGAVETRTAFEDDILAAWSGLLGTGDPLWFSTKGDVAASGVSGLAGWDSSDLLAFGDPALSLESPTTAGTLGFGQNWSPSSYNHDALHYVTVDITVGSSAFQLKAGDLLLSGDAATTFIGSDPTPDPGFSNSLGVDAEHVYVYRGATPGDYVVGSYALLLEDPFGDGDDVTGISLVESDTLFGDITLQAGDFLLLREGGSEDQNVYLFDTTDVGAGATTGNVSILIDGSDIDLNRLSGIELVEMAAVVGGRTLEAGSLLLSQDESEDVGNNAVPVEKHDIFAIAPSKTTLVFGATIADATLVFDGSDVNLNTPGETLDALTLTLSAATNTAPVITAVTPDLGTVSEDASDSGAIGVSAMLGGYSDVDGGSRGVAITAATVSGGSWEYSTDGTTWLALGAVAESNALLLNEADAVRFLPDGENGEMPTMTFRGWDHTMGSAGAYISITASGGNSAFSAVTDTAKIDVTAVNDAPLAANALLATVDEDTLAPAGASLDTLLGAGFNDVDTGDTFAGVAVTGNTASAVSQGAWQYSSDAGGNWFDIGIVGDDATALALDASSLVRFVPVGDFNGTPASLSLRALDSSYGGGFSTTALAVQTRVNIDTGTPGTTTVFSTAVNTVGTGIDAVNDDPTNAGTTPADQAATEQTTVVLDLSAIGLADVDVASGGTTLTLTTGSGTLTAGSGGGVTVAGSGSGTLTLDGTLANLNTFLDAATISYTGATDVTGDDADTIAVLFNDKGNTGSGGGTDIALGTVNIDIAAVNDAPANTGTLPASVTLDEDTLTLLDLSAITLADVDAGATPLTVTLSSSSGGSLSASSGGGVTVAGSGTGTLTLGGTLGALNTYLDAASVSFLGAANVNGAGADGIAVVVNDNAGSGNLALGTIAVNINAINDAPVLANASLAAITHDNATPPGAPVSTLLGAGFGDPDTGASLAGIAVVANPANASSEGAWQYSSDGSHWFDIGATTDGPAALALDAATRVRFVPVAGFVGVPDALTVRALDDSYAGGFSTTTAGVQARVIVDTSAPGGSSAIAGSSNTIATTVIASPVAPPVLGVPTPFTDASPTFAAPADDPAAAAGDEGDEAVEVPVPTGAGGHGEVGPASAALAPAGDDAETGQNAATDAARERELQIRRDSPGGGPAPSKTQAIGVEALNAPPGATETGFTRVAGSDGDRASDAGSVLASAALGDGFDALRRDLAENTFFTPVVVGSAAAAGSGLSVGYAAWLARGGMLAASLMSSMPAWRVIDPLPVLARMDDEEDEGSSDSLHSLISDHERTQAAVPDAARTGETVLPGEPSEVERG